MHQGDISAKVSLSEFKNKEHFYALGASEDLKGEIQIFDSKPFNTRVVDSALQFDKSLDQNASLLVYASVERWESFKIPDSITSYEVLENFIQQTAKINRIDVDQPFPFMLEGRANYVDWHVIDWKYGDTEHSHEKHINSGLNGRLLNVDVKMLGFYSNAHHAIFTHHTTNMHIHMLTENKEIAGHVDGLKLSDRMILKLPKL